MSEEKELTVTISRSPAYDQHKLRTEGLDIDRVIKFNNFEKIEVTQEELDAIGLHRWLIIQEKENVE
jgi:hypothetical protein